MPSKYITESHVEAQIEREMKSLQMPQAPPYNLSFKNRVIVFGLPVVKKDKLEKLRNYLLSSLQTGGVVIEKLQIPISEKDETKGMAFIKCSTFEMAKDLVLLNNGRLFDKRHTYRIIMLDEYEKVIGLPTEYREPPKAEFKYKKDMLSWLLQKQCHDQFLVNYANTISIFEMSPSSIMNIIHREEFTEIHSFWSSYGTYLASMHKKGVALWGGPNFDQITKYGHKSVQHLTFSPKQNFLVTYSLIDNFFHIIIWNLLLENDVKEFIIANEEKTFTCWPQVSWSYDDSYFAMLQKEKISVYESCSGLLLSKKSIEVPGLQNFKWSNNSHLIAYWVPEINNSPAKIVLIEIPSKKEIFMKNLFNVSDINLFWSSQDEYLAVLGERWSKKKMTNEGMKLIGLTANLEIFRMQEREIPVEKIELKDKRSAIDFQWEPNGCRFALIAVHQNSHHLVIGDVKVGSGNQEIIHHAFQPNIKMNTVRWSPKGQYLVCGATRLSSIEFIDGGDGTLFHKADHPNLGDLSWDPTGRYVVSSSYSLLSDANECSVIFWSFTGKMLQQKTFSGLKQFMWRPRPPCLLSDQKLKEIKKNMSKYNQKFSQEDELMSNESKRKQLESRRKTMTEWNHELNQAMEHFINEKSIRVERRKGLDTDDLEVGQEEEMKYMLVTKKSE